MVSLLAQLSSRNDLSPSMRIAIGQARELLVDLRVSAPPLALIPIDLPTRTIHAALARLNRDVRVRGAAAWRSQLAAEILQAEARRPDVQR